MDPRPDINGFRRRLAGGGVYYGWFVVGATFVALFTAYGTTYTFGVFFRRIVDTFGGSHANISLIFSLQTFVIYAESAVLGFVIDRYDITRLYAIGATLLVAGLIGASQFTSFLGVVVSYGLVSGTGIGILYVIAYTTPIRWFDRRQGLALGVATAGGGIGILSLPALSSELINLFGWQTAYLVLAAVLAVLLGIAALLIEDSPQAVGVEPGKELREEPQPRSDGKSLRAHLSTAYGDILSVGFVLFAVGYMLAYAPIYVLQVHLVEHAAVAEVGAQIGVLAISVWGAMNAVGKLVNGRLADRFGPTTVVAASSGVVSVAAIVLAFVALPPVFLGLAVVLGFSHGGVGALMSVMMASLFDTENFATMFGVASIGFAISGSLFPYLGGLAFDVFETYIPAFVGVGVLGLVAAVCLVLSKQAIIRAESSA